MDLTSRNIWEKKHKLLFLFHSTASFQSEMKRTELHICLLWAINSFPVFLLHSVLFFFLLWHFIFSLTCSMQVLLQSFNRSHWFNPVPSLFTVSVFNLILTSWKVCLNKTALLICIKASLSIPLLLPINVLFDFLTSKMGFSIAFSNLHRR